MHDLWPETKFVHLIRDGRDVCLSMMNWKKADSSAGQFSAWKEDRVSTGALWWELNVRLGRQDGGSLAPELYHEVHYEALVSEPEETCANLCDFLGLSYDDAMLRFHEGREIADPDLDAKKGWRPLTPRAFASGASRCLPMTCDASRRRPGTFWMNSAIRERRARPARKRRWPGRHGFARPSPGTSPPRGTGYQWVGRREPLRVHRGMPQVWHRSCSAWLTPIPKSLSSSRRTGSRAGSRSAGG